MINRVKKLLELEQMSPSQFADEIQLQRSSLSHVLSGRNKPSLDFVMKIKNRFSEINLEWLIFGKGHMFLSKSEKEVVVNTNPIKEKKTDDNQQSINFEAKIEPIQQRKQNENDITLKTEVKSVSPSSGKASKVIIFYQDGTFVEYSNKS